MSHGLVKVVFGAWLAASVAWTAWADTRVSLTEYTVVVRGGDRAPGERAAERILVEEAEARTGYRAPVSTAWPPEGAVIALTVGSADPGWGRAVPRREGTDLPETKPEGYRLVHERSGGRDVVWIVGADARGVMFGAGRLLRESVLTRGSLSFAAGLDIATSPAYPIRGHQLGYRARANSYDGWGEAEFDRHIRELAIFGNNAIENIPFQDTDVSPHWPMSREEMNRVMSEICDRYDQDYWLWTPAEFDLADEAKRAEELDRHEALYRECPRLDGIFFPGGDPGDNPPEKVMPFLRDLAERLERHHPKARVWVSPQGFSPEEQDYFYGYLAREEPEWLGGVVAGPQTTELRGMRARIPARYPLRDYPDITHTVRCQYPVLWWDQAFSLTLGRECPNPRPLFYALVHERTAPPTDGFISYSDGVHDDVNKFIWNVLAWDPTTPPQRILKEYARFFFGAAVGDEAADGILALERNWEGPLDRNSGVDATLAYWQQLERRSPELADNWRWQLCLIRAYYDAYLRHRLLYETELEKEANAILARAAETGADAAMAAALAVLKRAETEPARPELRTRVVDLCEALFRSIDLQTSVKKYGASGSERGAILDFLDYPLNNRWWLEDEFNRLQGRTEEEKVARLRELAAWEDPGPGGYYDDIGNLAKSPHVVRSVAMNTEPPLWQGPIPGFAWWDDGYSRARLSWQCGMWPEAMVYEGLDPSATYTLRLTGYGEALPSVDGEWVKPTVYGKEMGEFKEFPVPAKAVEDGQLKVRFEIPDERHLNWRQRSRLSEVWLVKTTR